MKKYININILIYSLITVLVIFAMLLWLREKDLFVLNRVKVVGNDRIPKKEIIRLANLDFKKEIFDIDTDDVKGRLLAEQVIEKASIRRRPPSSVVISIKEKDLIACAAGSQVRAIDIDGQVVLPESPIALYDLPMITGVSVQTNSFGDREMPEQMRLMIKILKVIRSMNFQLYHEISEIHYSRNSGVILYTRGKAIPIVLGMDNYEKKIINLTIFYNHVKNREGLLKFKSIDVRFDKQVVVCN